MKSLVKDSARGTIKFAHMSDCHIGSWRDPKMRECGIESFLRATDICIDKNVDFIVISGDLFNTSIPSIDSLKRVTSRLKELKDRDVPVYFVAGSHDYSPNGRTILDVLERADLMANVAKGEGEGERLMLAFTIDKKTGAKITGLPGKKGMLERVYYESLEKQDLEKEDGYKIFVFHTALTELKPKILEKMDSCPISLLPQGFAYYAGGHVHIRQECNIEGYGKVVYPGPLFPNNFREIEELKGGSFVIVTAELKLSAEKKQEYEQRIEYFSLQAYNVETIRIDCDRKTVEETENIIMEQIKAKEFFNTIVTIRLTGTLEAGKISDIDFQKIFDMLYDKGAYFVMKSTYLLKTTAFEEMKMEAKSIEEIEATLIKEHANQIKSNFLKNKDEELFVKELMHIFDLEKLEGERNQDFEKRIVSDFKRSIA